MSRVVAIGGVFMKSKDPEALRAWYREMLGMDVSQWGAMLEPDGSKAPAVWNPFAVDSKKFAPSDREFMINFRVDDADGLVAAMRAKGANVLDRRDASEYGIFCYVVDPDGTLLELWQPASEA